MSVSAFQALSMPAASAARSPSLLERVFSRVASVLEGRPVAAASHAWEAVALRRLARKMEFSDPGFAADLRGAATRHESLDDGYDPAPRPWWR